MIYKNTGPTAKTFHGVTFQPGETKKVRGRIYHHKFISVNSLPQEPPVENEPQVPQATSTPKVPPNEPPVDEKEPVKVIGPIADRGAGGKRGGSRIIPAPEADESSSNPPTPDSASVGDINDENKSEKQEGE